MRVILLATLGLVAASGAPRGQSDGAPAPGTPPGPLWVSQVGTGTFGLAFGDGGGQLFVAGTHGEAYLYSSYDPDPPEPFATFALDGYDGLAAGADTTDLYLAAGFDIVGPTTSQGYMLRCDSSSPLPLWKYSFTPQLLSFPAFDLSRDGETVVSSFVLDVPPTNEFRVHDPDTGAVTRLLTYPLLDYSSRLDLSPDGSVFAHSPYDGTGSVWVHDLATGDVRFTTSGSIPEKQALSRRGGVLVVRERVVGVAWHVRVFVRGPGGYVEVLDVPTPDTEVPGDVAVSDDGSVVAAGWYDVTHSHWLAKVRAYDAHTGDLLMERELAGNPLSPLPNVVADLELSADGSRLALGVWGAGVIPSSGSVSELTVWDPKADANVASFPDWGTVFEVALSADGTRVACHRLSVHASSGYTATFVQLYDVGGADLALHGVPAIGGPLTADVYGPAGATAVLLAAAGLASPPIVGGAGTLYLDPDTLGVVALATVGAGGIGQLGLTIPSAPALVGLTLFLQGATLAPASLGHTTLQLTLLP